MSDPTGPINDGSNGSGSANPPPRTLPFRLIHEDPTVTVLAAPLGPKNGSLLRIFEKITDSDGNPQLIGTASTWVPVTFQTKEEIEALRSKIVVPHPVLTEPSKLPQ